MSIYKVGNYIAIDVRNDAIWMNMSMWDRRIIGGWWWVCLFLKRYRETTWIFFFNKYLVV